MKGLKHRGRRIAAAVVGVVAFGAIALVVPADASAATSHASTVTTVKVAAPGKHTNIWEW